MTKAQIERLMTKARQAQVAARDQERLPESNRINSILWLMEHGDFESEIAIRALEEAIEEAR